MTKPACSEAEFIEMIEAIGVSETARKLKINLRTAFDRRTRIEKRLGRKLNPPSRLESSPPRNVALYPQRQFLDIEDGIVPIFSDAHYWPGEPSTAHRAFVKFLKQFQKDIRAVINNGDALDGASISRHPSIGWENKPSLIHELEACQERLGEIEAAAGRVPKIWNLGNHDARFETRIANVAPEFAKVSGVHLKDHFALWESAWATWINDTVVVKHRFKSGIHAPHNNAMWAGKSMVTGHLHSQKVQPITDYNGTRWGVDSGTLADPYGPQFVSYTEDSPVSWISGFCFLTFHKGRLLPPELVTVIGPGEVTFRGKVYAV